VALLISEAWLKCWTNTDASTDALAVQLTEAGFEVDNRVPQAVLPSSIVIGKLMSVTAHPNADRLNVCEVQLNSDPSIPTVTIVCGCSTVCEGIKVAVAQVGTVLPNGIEIESRPLRGVQSSGMICSRVELGLPSCQSGIWMLPEDAPLGQSISSYLNQVPDTILHVDVTPNRGDCLSIRGLAQELATLEGGDLMLPSEIKVPSFSKLQTLAFEVKDTACLKYHLMQMNSIDMTRSLPDWLIQRLLSSGQTSVNPVVDILNYVMFEYGQPMHAFDRAQVKGTLSVQKGLKNKNFELLNGECIDLDPDYLMIVDEAQPLALAGVMGGCAAAVTEATESILLESACFSPKVIARMCRSTHLHSESSFRFERGVDPALVEMALNRAADLIQTYLGGVPTHLGAIESISKPVEISLTSAAIERLLGLDMEASVITDRLKALNCDYTGSPEIGWQVCPPSYRYDLIQTEDLVEEMLRLEGMHALPSVPQSIPAQLPVLPPVYRIEQTLRQRLIALGFSEHVGYSFVDERQQIKVCGDAKAAVRVLNPISSKLNVMRQSCWTGLLEAAEYNLARQKTEIRLFEIGACFDFDDSGALIEHRVVSGVLLGMRSELQWGLPPEPIDFYDVKGICEVVLKDLLPSADWNIEPIDALIKALHPGRAAHICDANQDVIGSFGLLHPQLMSQFKFTNPVGVFECRLKPMSIQSLQQTVMVSKYPSMRRDLSFIVDESIVFSDILDFIQENQIKYLQKVKLFDIYQDVDVDQSRKSIALALWFQSSDQTLTDDQISQILGDLVEMLKDAFNIEMRESK